MNCRQYQAQITDALARDSAPLPHQIAVHVDSCSACREFQTKQQALFHSIDAELQSLVNQPVPPSFLPLVRDRIGKNVEAHRWASSGWPLLAATAALIIVFGLASKFHSLMRPPNTSQNAATSLATLAPTEQPPQAIVKIIPVHHGSRSRKNALAASTEISRVIVLPEEQKAFRRFVAQVPEHQRLTLALTRPATLRSVEPVGIAPLQIATLEVQPLEGSETE